MKALTLHQPWASLIALGEKTIETRSWPTWYRGAIAIHAGKKTHERVMDCSEAPYIDLLVKHGLHRLDDIPFGAVIAVARLSRCELMTDEVIDGISHQEYMLGNYEPGRYAWHLRDVQVLDAPIPARGYQGLWDWERPT